MPDASLAIDHLSSTHSPSPPSSSLSALLINNPTRPPLLATSGPCSVIDPKDGSVRPVTILSLRRRPGTSSSHPLLANTTITAGDATESTLMYYVHIEGEDKRMDGWVDSALVIPRSEINQTLSGHVGDINALTTAGGAKGAKGKRKRKGDDVEALSDGVTTPRTAYSRVSSPSTVASNPAATAKANAGVVYAETGRGGHHRSSSDAATAVRNIDKVYYGAYEIKTWYFSPYPLEDDHDEHNHAASPRPGSSSSASSIRTAGAAAIASPLGSSAGHHANGLKRVKRRDSNSLARETPPTGDHLANPVHHPSHSSSSNNPHSHSGGALGGSVKEAAALWTVLDADTAARKAQSPSISTTAIVNGKSSGSGNGGVAYNGRNLWICEGCFKYMKTYAGYAVHRKQCGFSHPPGRKVYQRGGHIIWEVDGADAKLYAQNLSLFGKLFIDHKTLYFDVEPFLFYVLTEAGSSSFDHTIGFFSKEKNSYDGYNLACIITFPPYQRKSFGTLMIEFSYALSARQGTLGTPERPLSDLGLKGYVSFWSAVVLRTLKVALGGSEGEEGGGGDKRKLAKAKIEMLETRCDLLGLPREAMEQEGLEALRALTGPDDERAEEKERKRRRAAKGFAGSPPSTALVGGGERKGLTVRLRRKPKLDTYTPTTATVDADDSVDDEYVPPWSTTSAATPTSTPPAAGATTTTTTTRTLRERRTSHHRTSVHHSSPVPLTSAASASPSTTRRKAPLHPVLLLSSLVEGSTTVETTLDLLSKTTHLRPEDISVALADCGLLSLRVNEQGGAEGGVVLTKEAVEEAARKRKVRGKVLDESCLLV